MHTYKHTYVYYHIVHPYLYNLTLWYGTTLNGIAFETSVGNAVHFCFGQAISKQVGLKRNA